MTAQILAAGGETSGLGGRGDRISQACRDIGDFIADPYSAFLKYFQGVMDRFSLRRGVGMWHGG